MEDWYCAHCGEVTSRPTWLAVDARERPDLIEEFATLIEFECLRCLELVRRQQPLLVLRLARSAPLIAARATDGGGGLENLGGVVATVRRELWGVFDEVPEHPAIVTFDELKAGVHEDIDADIEAFGGGASGSVAYNPAYRSFLLKIAVIRELQYVEGGLKELAFVTGEAQLREVVEQQPQILTDQAEHLAIQRAEEAKTEAERRVALSMHQVLRCLREGDLSGAWSLLEAADRRYWDETVVPRLQAIEIAFRDGSWPEVAQIGRELQDVLPLGTRPEVLVDVAHFMATALGHYEGPDREQHLETAIETGQFAISLLDAYPDIDTPARRIPIVSNLGATFGFRPRGDPAWNYERAIAYFTDAIELSHQAGDRDSWAMAQTNLANTLIERGNAGDHDRAREHLRLALTHRTRQRNPMDWAYTQSILGLSYSRDGSGDRVANLRAAILHFRKALDAARPTGDVFLVAMAAHNLAAEQLWLARMPATAPDASAQLLDHAEASAIESLQLSPADSAPLRFGRAWVMIGKIRAQRADRDGAISAFRTALSVLSADLAPNTAREASRLLLELAEAQGDLELAGDAAARLVEGAAAVISARSRADDRMSEQRGEKTTDFRFAANALVRANRPEEAVRALELGRTRELGLLTLEESIDVKMLTHLDPSLGAEAQQVSGSFRADILGLDEHSVSDRSEQLARLRAALRRTPTFEQALDPPTLQEVGKVAQPQRPLVYLGSAPTGSFAIIVDRDDSGGLDLEAIHAPDCDSRAIAHLVIGLDADGNQVTSNPYLLAQAFEPELLDTSIAALTPLVGEKLLRPLAESLTCRGAVGVTLVPAGLLGVLPLHAIAWSDSAEDKRTLLDDFDVTFAPSARLQTACIQRASTRRIDAVRFVGIANPLPHPRPLDGAELELELVQRFVPTDNARVLKGEAATKQRVVEALPLGTHLHLACHGGGRLFDPLFSAALSLADEEELSAEEIARLNVPARLVVASACETGVPQGGYEAVDESLDLASAFVAAGAAGVVSTLWSVDDFPTALIISKFYEGLFVAGKPPATALRDAQIWIRDADAAAINAYILTREPLRALRGRRGSPTPPSGPSPYSAPSLWAAFAFSGA